MTKLCYIKRDTPQNFDIVKHNYLGLLSKETRKRNKWCNLKHYCQQSITNVTFNVTLSVQSVQCPPLTCTHAFGRFISRTLNRCSRALARSCLFCRTASVKICAGTRRKEVS